MATEVNLKELALERTERRPAAANRGKSAWVSRYAIPGTILSAFAILIGWAMRDSFTTRRPVTVTPVLVSRAEVQQSGTPLFQAAGWIEPRPTPINVAAMTEGVVQELRVVGGQAVQTGEAIAQLIDTDARYSVKEAQTALLLREAELKGVQAELRAAQSRREKPVHLQAQLAEAESLQAKAQTELAKLPFQVRATAARLEFAKNNFEGKQSAGTAVTGRIVQQAESEYLALEAEAAELDRRRPNLEREVDVLAKKTSALSEQLKLLVEETRQVEEAEAKVAGAKAAIEQSRLRIERAQLALERTTIRSPISGVVLQVVAHPGSRVMGLDSNATISSSTVVTMYDPTQLQIRADVRLEDVPLVETGQPVEITTASSRETIRGTVLRPTSTANVQKNTLEVKVAIDNPPAALRPEMLVSTTFLAPKRASEPSDSPGETERLLVPKDLVDRSGTRPAVWVVDPSGLARQKGVTLGKASTPTLVEIAEGLNVTDKLIVGGREGLREREPVTISGETSGPGQ